MMEHPRKCSEGQHAIDAVKIISNIQKYFDKAASIPVYINMMDTAPKKAPQAKLPISHDMLVAIATKAILTHYRFP